MHTVPPGLLAAGARLDGGAVAHNELPARRCAWRQVQGPHGLPNHVGTRVVRHGAGGHNDCEQLGRIHARLSSTCFWRCGRARTGRLRASSGHVHSQERRCASSTLRQPQNSTTPRQYTSVCHAPVPSSCALLTQPLSGGTSGHQVEQVTGIFNSAECDERTAIVQAAHTADSGSRKPLRCASVARGSRRAPQSVSVARLAPRCIEKTHATQVSRYTHPPASSSPHAGMQAHTPHVHPAIHCTHALRPLASPLT